MPHDEVRRALDPGRTPPAPTRTAASSPRRARTTSRARGGTDPPPASARATAAGAGHGDRARPADAELAEQDDAPEPVGEPADHRRQRTSRRRATLITNPTTRSVAPSCRMWTGVMTITDDHHRVARVAMPPGVRREPSATAAYDPQDARGGAAAGSPSRRRASSGSGRSYATISTAATKAVQREQQRPASAGRPSASAMAAPGPVRFGPGHHTDRRGPDDASTEARARGARRSEIGRRVPRLQVGRPSRRRAWSRRAATSRNDSTSAAEDDRVAPRPIATAYPATKPGRRRRRRTSAAPSAARARRGAEDGRRLRRARRARCDPETSSAISPPTAMPLPTPTPPSTCPPASTRSVRRCTSRGPQVVIGRTGGVWASRTGRSTPANSPSRKASTKRRWSSRTRVGVVACAKPTRSATNSTSRPPTAATTPPRSGTPPAASSSGVLVRHAVHLRRGAAELLEERRDLLGLGDPPSRGRPRTARSRPRRTPRRPARSSRGTGRRAPAAPAGRPPCDARGARRSSAALVVVHDPAGGGDVALLHREHDVVLQRLACGPRRARCTPGGRRCRCRSRSWRRRP